MDTKISISGDGIDYVAKLSAPEKVMPALAAAMDRENLLTTRHIMQDYLNFPPDGPTVPQGLRHITGRLFRSAIATKTRLRGATLEASIGSNVFYAGIHEFGGTVSSRPTRSKNPAYAKKHPNTKPYSLPARAPFRRGITDRLSSYTKTFSATLLNLE